jgi:hypothetical protein
MSQKPASLALAYDGAAYGLSVPIGQTSQTQFCHLLRSLDPFQKAEIEWLRALNGSKPSLDNRS